MTDALAPALSPRLDRPAPIDPASHAAFAQRLQTVIRSFGTILDLAQKVKVSDSSIHLWLRGSEPTRGKLVRLADAAGVSVEWLATGRGEMRADRVPQGYALVPRYELEQGRVYEGVDYLALKTEWIARLPGNPVPQALFLFQAPGDAMAPTIADGDLVLTNTSDPDFRDGGIYVIHPAAMPAALPVMIRRVRQRADGNFDLVRDDDPEHRETATGFRVLGRVIWAGGVL